MKSSICITASGVKLSALIRQENLNSLMAIRTQADRQLSFARCYHLLIPKAEISAQPEFRLYFPENADIALKNCGILISVSTAKIPWLD